MLRSCLLVLVALSLLAALPAVAKPALTLAENGSTRYQIVLPNHASAPQQHAARELASFLAQITGAQFPVVSEADYTAALTPTPAQGERGRPAIFVGLSAAARKACPSASVAGLGREGLVIKTAPPHLLLYGGEPRGTLYAVYTFLEDHLGCRWWAPGASTIPKRPTLRLGALNDRQVPVVEYREPFFCEAFDGDWAVRNKSNGASTRITPEQGGKVTYEGFVHTFASLVPPDQYFDQHPEWFPEINGKRTRGYVQLCLTNEELKKFVAQRVLERLRANPTASIISVSQNDAAGYCECPNCKALDEKEGSHSGSLLHFVNYVAREVAKEFPNVAVDTLAYQYTRKPPKFVRPEPNVIVRLCSIECNFARPLTDKSNAAFFSDLVGWSKVSRRLYIWDYVTNFAHYLWPQPNIYSLGPNVRTFVDHGVRGIFEQGSYTMYNGDLAPLKSWLLAKLLWNPRRDPKALVREFMAGYFGAAGPYVQQYVDLMHRDAVEHQYFIGCFNPSNSPFPSEQTLAACERAFDQAARAVAGDATLERRVRLARLPLDYVRLCRGPQVLGADEFEALLARFQQVVDREAMPRLSEGGNVQDNYRQWREALRVARALPTIKPDEIRVWPLPDTWVFATDPKDQGVTARWFDAAFDDSAWKPIKVGQGTGWETQGFPGYIGMGWYRLRLPIPADLARKHLYLFFGAVDEDAWVYLNGKLVCDHSVEATGLAPEQIWTAPFMQDLAGMVTPGETATLAVRVLNRLGMGGIHLPVYLVSTDRDLDQEVVRGLIARANRK